MPTGAGEEDPRRITLACEQRRRSGGGELERLGASVRGRRGTSWGCREDPWAWEISPKEARTILPLLSHTVLDGGEKPHTTV